MSQATIVFVLGGPGSGKGTQCPEISRQFHFTHLCAGDLLQKEVDTGSEYGKMIEQFKKEGKLVPSEVIVRLLQKAMEEESGNKKFLIDGFPRSEENRAAFENIIEIEPKLVIFLDCPEEVLIKRVLNRNQGRVDDNIDTLRKRLKVFYASTLPVIDYYNSKEKVQKVDGSKPMDEVFDLLKTIFFQFEIDSHMNECI